MLRKFLFKHELKPIGELALFVEEFFDVELFGDEVAIFGFVFDVGDGFEGVFGFLDDVLDGFVHGSADGVLVGVGFGEGVDELVFIGLECVELGVESLDFSQFEKHNKIIFQYLPNDNFIRLNRLGKWG